MDASRPVSSFTSRSAACSDVSPSETAPFGSPHRSRPRVAINATYGTPSRNESTAPPDECSFRIARLACAILDILAVHDHASCFFRKGVHFLTKRTVREALRGGAHAFSHHHHGRGACRSSRTGVAVHAYTPAGPDRGHHREAKGILETGRESRIRRRDAEVPGGVVADRHRDLLPEPRPRRVVRPEGHRRGRVRRRVGDGPRDSARLPRTPPPFARAHVRRSEERRVGKECKSRWARDD